MVLHSLFARSDDLPRRVAECRVALFRLALMWCHDRALADDLTQDALTKALRNADQLRDPQKLRPWLYGILANCWRDHLRGLRPMEDIESIEEHWLDGGGDPEQALGRTQLAQRVRREIGRLSVGQREVLALVDLEECTYAQVAEILSIPIGTVMSRLCRARATLRDALADAQGERPALRSVK